MQDFEYRAQFQGAAQAEGFQAVKAPDPTPLMEQNAQIEQNNMEAQARARLSDMQEQEKFRQVYEDKRLQQLAAFSKTLSDVSLKAVQAYNEAEMLAGLNEDLINPVANAAEQAEYNQQVAALKQEDENFQAGVDNLKKAGAPEEATQRMRFAGGWRGYGQRMRALSDIGAKAKPYIMQALESDTTTPIPDPLNPGETFTPSEAFQLSVERGEEYLETAMNVLTNQFFRENGVLNFNRGIVNNVLMPTMRKARAEISQTQRAEIVKEKQEVGKQEAQQLLVADVQSDNYSGKSFEGIVLHLDRYGGMTKTEAVKHAFKYIVEAEENGVLSHEEVNKIFAETHGPTGQTIARSFPDQIAKAKSDIKKQRYDREVLEDKMNEQEARGRAEEAREYMLNDGTFTQAQALEAAEKFRREHNLPTTSTAYKRLIDFANNDTVDQIDLAEDRKNAMVDAKTGFLTTERLREKYPALVRDGISEDLRKRVEQNDQFGQPPADVVERKTKELNDSLDATLNLVAVRSGLHHSSVNGMKDHARRQMIREAGQLMMTQPPKASSWEEALQLSMGNVEKLVETGKGVYARTGYGARIRFTNFTTPEGYVTANAQDGATLSQDIEVAASEDAKSTGYGSLTDVSEDPFFTDADAKFINENGLSPNSPAGRKLDTYVRAYNKTKGNETGEYLTHDKARDLLLTAHGFKPEPRRTDKKDEYEEAAKLAGLDRLLAIPTATGVNHVAVAGGLPPATIRTGDAGVTDVMQAATHYKMEPNTVPLAGAVFALESARGTQPSGRNNFFGIKGSGTVRTTTEYEGQVTEAQFRDYDNGLQSVADFGQLLKQPRYAAVRAAKTPREAAIALKEAGYATDPQYANKMIRLYKDMGIDPDVPFNNQRLVADSPYSDPSTMGVAARRFITGNTGTSTGPHVHVGYYKGGAYQDPSPILRNLMVDGSPLTDGRFRMTSGYGSRVHPVHGTRKFHRGVDYATEIGTQITVRGARYVTTYTDTSGGGVMSIYRLPGGGEILLMHGSKDNLR